MRHRLGLAVLAGVLVAACVSVPASALEVGQKAPDFTLPGSGGGPPVKLADLLAKGPVVIYTFIQAFTPT